ncbi:MAG: gfo/Idh/MocA family oxidoreductase [Anaerolineaceae bacterium]|nr:gfo/Idh/MocA family oxidoreductase [Anaerolineaceae bacterium]
MLKIGIVGSGFMGRTHAAAWAKLPVELVGICSADPERAQKLAVEYATQPFESLDELLKQVDVIDVCTPTHLHRDMVIQAAAAGKHVVCEKPLARTVAQAAEMIRVCKQANVHLLVAQVLRFAPAYVQAKEVVARGDIGKVAVQRFTRCSALPKWASDNWLMDFDRSGGMMLDLMVHDFDFARWVAGDVESVFAKSLRGQRPNATEDYALVILKHTSGAISNIEGGWAYAAGMFRTGFEIAGDAGLIEQPMDSTTPLAVYMKEKNVAAAEAMIPTSPLAEDPYWTQLKHFYDVMTTDVQPCVTAEDGMAAVQIGLAAIESVRSGRQVQIAEVA